MHSHTHAAVLLENPFDFVGVAHIIVDWDIAATLYKSCSGAYVSCCNDAFYDTIDSVGYKLQAERTNAA